MEKESQTKKILYNGAFIKVVEHSVIKENGAIVKYEVVEEKPGVLIVPVTEKGEIILLKTERYRFGEIFEVVAGAIRDDEGETPLEAGKRELQEEAGLKAKNFTLLSAHVDNVHSLGENFIFLAENLTSIKSSPEKDEKIKKILEVTPEDALKLSNGNKVPSLRNKAAIWAAYIHMLSKK